MNFEIIPIVGTLIAIVGLLIVLMIRRRRPRSKKETDYRALFNMGIIFFSAGLAINIATRIMNPLLILGLVYFAKGLANKDQWKTHEN
jgi:O-antigen/teichoic acid export membrane protein